MSPRRILIACFCIVFGLVVLAYVGSSSRGGTLSGAQPTAEAPRSTATATGLPVLTISDAKVAEGNNGITEVPFTVALDRPSEQPVSVVYTTSDGSATAANGDYIASRSTLTFLPGEMSKIITVQLSSDTHAERDELFHVTLSDALHATIGMATGTGTIINDDQVAASAPTAAPTFADIRATTILPIATLVPTPSATPTAQPSPIAVASSVDHPTRANALYLPWVQRPERADLVVESIVLFPNNLQIVAGSPVEVRVTIRNNGGAAATTPFWVDLYINPAQPPQVNMPWNTVCGITPCQGVTWHVTQTLAPDQRLTLTTMQPEHTHTLWEGWLPAGTTTLAAYVDSWNTSGTSGAVREDDENNNRAELNGLTVTGTNPPSLEGSASQVSRRP